jgi:hypothetical protein
MASLLPSSMELIFPRAPDDVLEEISAEWKSYVG